MMFRRITIIGLGLIGGSLGLAIKKQCLAKKIIGVSRKASTIRKAKAIGAADVVTRDIKKGVKGSDLIILTTPVLTIVDIARRIVPYLKKGCIVIDAGSTKGEIVKKIENILPQNVSFIGSHPIAGSEKSGVKFSEVDLFKNAYCILTKTRYTDKEALIRVGRFWRALDMRVEVMDPDGHDRVISKLSHLPHAIAVALCNVSDKKDLHFAAGGFRDTTRIASGSPALWKDIFITNRNNLARDIKVFRKELSKFEKTLKSNDNRRLLKLLKKAKTIRDAI